MEYNLKSLRIDDFYNIIPGSNKYLNEKEIKKLISKIGIFKLKGYLYPIKKSSLYKEDVFFIFLFDRFLIKEISDLVYEIETNLKSILIEEAYNTFQNPFFYLIKDHYHESVKIDATINNWKNPSKDRYFKHYIQYYLQKYNFHDNFCKYLKGEKLIDINLNINYPPFHYLIESATLGLTIKFILNLKINNIGKYFFVNNPKTFKSYLLRLNEIRNRLAHFNRIYNRNYRSVKGVGKYKSLRKNIENHSLYDVILFLLLLTDRLNYNSILEFEEIFLKQLFEKFKNDYFINTYSFNLIKNYDNSNFERLKKFIIGQMK